MSRNFFTPLTLPPGTASNAPLNLQSGPLLTTPAAGAVEYDGKVAYITPGGRGVSPSMLTYRLNADLAGANVSTAQSIFGVGVTLQANTVYAFQSAFTLSKTTGTGSHAINLAFDGGTATFNNFSTTVLAGLHQTTPPTSNSLVTSSFWYGMQNSTAELTYPSGIAGSTRTFFVNLQGTFSIANGGTFIPRYRLSSAPGGAYSTLAGSYIAIWPIGAAGANTSVGPWA